MTTDTGFLVVFDAADGIATITMVMPGRSNKVNGDFVAGLGAALDEALGAEGLRGIVVTSGHADFCVGGDLDLIYGVSDPAQVLQMTARLNGLYRRIEKAGVPVVAALTGSALGGGFELALACHYRIALNDPRIQVGLPEVSLGLIPGGGGTQRLPRLVGFQAAMELITSSRLVRSPQAKEMGLLDAVEPDVEMMQQRWREWLLSHPQAKQPWDQDGFRFPGDVQPGTGAARQLFMAAAAMVTQKTAGAFAAPEAVVCAIHEGSTVDFDSALKVEARLFARLAVSHQAKDMIRTFWYHRNAVAKQEGLPTVVDPEFHKVGILGAGMMGAGLAFLLASRQFDVVLKDVRTEALEAGVARCRELAGKHEERRGTEMQSALLGRIRPTLENADLVGCDLIIEAIVENRELKQQVTRELEPLMSESGVWASNTSALPISVLAGASLRPQSFIGLHFFSPVEKMPLVEVIVGVGTSQQTLARALAFVRRIGRTAIVVNDGYGFYTTRLFTAYIVEAAELVAGGHDPVLVEWAARKAGMAISPLKVFDEITLSLGVHVLEQSRSYRSGIGDTAGARLIQRMVEMGRTGKGAGMGFYDYSTRPSHLWSGLRGMAEGVPTETGVEYIQRRIMLAQVLEAVRCLEEGILRNKQDAEIGAVMAYGFAPNAGGPLAWLDRAGLAEVVVEAHELAEAEGPRFAPPNMLTEMATLGERFFESS